MLNGTQPNIKSTQKQLDVEHSCFAGTTSDDLPHDYGRDSGGVPGRYTSLPA